MYWSLSNIPELKTLDPVQQKQVWRVCSRKPLCHPLGFLSGMVFGILLALSGYSAQLMALWSNNIITSWVLLIATGAFAGLFLGQLQIYLTRKEVRSYLEKAAKLAPPL